MARLTSKGQLTVPKPVRDALDLREGDSVLFRVEDGRASIAKTPNLLELAGSIPVPPGKRGMPWDVILEEAYRESTRNRR